MRFLIRADASTTIGAGHVVRCVTLAKALQLAGHEILFVTRQSPGHLTAWIEAAGIRCLPLSKTPLDETGDADEVLSRLGAQPSFDWVIVDHYALGVRWETSLRASAERIMAIDDLGRQHASDAILDQNFHNHLHSYYAQNNSATGCLWLGPEYALVRPEFATLRPLALARRNGQLDRILVCMGGSDEENETSKVIEGLSQLPTELSMDIVIGAGNPHRASLEATCHRLPRTTLHIQTDRMAELMTIADCAITTGGGTTWERCVLGLPGLVTTAADNQLAIAQAVADAGGQQLLGWHADLAPADYRDAVSALDSVHLQRVSKTAATICDGRGAARIVALLTRQ